MSLLGQSQREVSDKGNCSVGIRWKKAECVKYSHIISMVPASSACCLAGWPPLFPLWFWALWQLRVVPLYSTPIFRLFRLNRINGDKWLHCGIKYAICQCPILLKTINRSFLWLVFVLSPGKFEDFYLRYCTCVLRSYCLLGAMNQLILLQGF